MALGALSFWLHRRRLWLRNTLGWEKTGGILGLVTAIPLAVALALSHYPLAIACLVVCAVLLLTWTWAVELPKISRWGIASSVVIVSLGLIYLINNKARTEKLEANFGTLSPAGDAPPPQNECVRVHPDAHFFVFFGNSIFVVNRFPTVLVKIDGRSYFSISQLPSGSVTLNVDIVDQEGKIIASIDGNNFRVNPNNIFDKKRPDESTLIVYDQFKTVVLSVRLDSSRYMTVSGSLNYKNRFMLLPDGSTVIGGLKAENNCSYGMSLDGNYFNVH
jgi:hypothetical protein